MPLTPVQERKIETENHSEGFKRSVYTDPKPLSEIVARLESRKPDAADAAATFIARAIKQNHGNPEILLNFANIASAFSPSSAITLVRALDIVKSKVPSADMSPGLALALYTDRSSGVVEREISAYVDKLLPSRVDKLKFIDMVMDHPDALTKKEAIRSLSKCLGEKYLIDIISSALSARCPLPQKSALEFLSRNPRLIEQEGIKTGLCRVLASKSYENANSAFDLGLKLSKESASLEGLLLDAATQSRSDYVILRRAVVIGRPTAGDLKKAEDVLKYTYQTRPDGEYTVRSLAIEVLSLCDPSDSRDSMQRLASELNSPKLLAELIRAAKSKGVGFVGVGLEILDNLSSNESNILSEVDDLECLKAIAECKRFLNEHPAECLWQMQLQAGPSNEGAADNRLSLISEICQKYLPEQLSSVVALIAKNATKASLEGINSAEEILQLDGVRAVSPKVWLHHARNLEQNERQEVRDFAKQMKNLSSPVRSLGGIRNVLGLSSWQVWWATGKK